VKLIYILTKNDILITRAFYNEEKAIADCKLKNTRDVPVGDPPENTYSYKRVYIADS